MRRIAAISLALLCGCSGSKVTPIATLRPAPAPVTWIALAPSGGVLADAIGVELLNVGVYVFDTRQTTSLFLRLNLSEEQVVEPQSLAELAWQGISAVLFVRTVAGRGDKPQSASVRLVHTRDGSLIAGLAWQNGDSGPPDTLADAIIRKDLGEAAQEIARALAKQMGWSL